MFLRTCLFMIAVTTLFSGCRRDNNYNRYAAVRNDELRILEDQNYILLDEVERLRAQLDSCHRANTSISKRNGSDEETLPQPMPNNDKKKDPYYDKDDEDPDDLAPPKINLGNESDKPASHFLPDSDKNNNNRTANKSKIKKTSHLNPPTLEELKPSDHEVHGIKINPFLTGGHNTDGKPGDEGVLVVFQPRNKEKIVIQPSGSVEISLNKVNQIASARPLAVWKFKASEVASHYRKTLRGTALEFDLPWPNKPPRSKRLNLTVTFTASNGKTFTARRLISIESKDMPAFKATQPKQKIRTIEIEEEPTEAPPVILEEEFEPTKKKRTPLTESSEQTKSTSSAPLIKKNPSPKKEWQPYRD